MEYEYDSWNRIQRMTYPDGEVVSYEYNKGGMLQRVTGQKNGQAYTYIDSLLYNKFELKERILYGNGSRSQYEYDILLRLDSLTAYDGENLHHLLQAIKYNYDAAGNITGITNSAGAVNGLGGLYHVEYSYNGLYRMTHAEGWHGSESNFYDMQMGYYPNGRIQHKKLARPNIGCRNCIGIYDNGYSYSYGNRLVRIEPIPIPTTQPGGGAVAPEPGTGSGDPTTVQINYDYSFQWDGAGNMTRQTDNIHNSVRRLSWDAENRLQGVKDNSYLSLYQYDANGERTYKLTGSYVAQNRSGVWRSYYSLTNATLYASPYMVATVKGYTKHYYAENERIASRIGDGGLSRIDTPIVDLTLCTWKLSTYSAYFDTVAQNRLSAPNYITTHLLDTLYQWKTPHGNTEPDCYWYHPDHLGSASWVTDKDGEVVQYLYYLPWGEDYLNQRRNGYSGARHTFSAKEKDTETGLSYFGARYYSSDLSIWLSVDPMSDKYPSLSPYVYCANNPIKLVDPNGEEIGDFYNLYGDYIGTDGKNDGKVYLVRDGASEIYIKENHRNKNIKYTKANDNNISIAFETTYEDIQQALVVYKKEGKNEEGGAFDNEGKWHDGKGCKDHVELPISVGRTSIHRHPWDRGNDYSKNYSTPEKASEGDLQSFTGFQQNIIVGKRMGNYDAFQGSTNRQPIMSFYGNDGAQDTPQCSITIIAAEKIINHRR